MFASGTQIPITLLCEMDTLCADVHSLPAPFFFTAFSFDHQGSDGSHLTMIEQLRQSVIQNKAFELITINVDLLPPPLLCHHDHHLLYHNNK